VRGKGTTEEKKRGETWERHKEREQAGYMVGGEKDVLKKKKKKKKT
jgi:hypothetical protein